MKFLNTFPSKWFVDLMFLYFNYQQGMSAGYCHETSFVFFSRFKLNPITATLRWLFLAVLSSPTSGRKAWPRSPLAASPSSSRYIVGSLGHLSEIICLRSISIICFLDTSHFAHFTQRVTQWFYISTGVSCHCTMVNRAKYFRWCHVFFLTDTFQTSLIIFLNKIVLLYAPKNCYRRKFFDLA